MLGPETTMIDTQSERTKKAKEAAEIIDGFDIPITRHREQMIKKSGQAFIRSNQGYYKPSFVVLTNTELYIYPDKDSRKHKDVYIVGQEMGIFIKKKQPCNETPENKFYPIEISLGFDDPESSQGIIVLFYDSQDLMDQWYDILMKATGCYEPWNFYTLSNQVS